MNRSLVLLPLLCFVAGCSYQMPHLSKRSTSRTDVHSKKVSDDMARLIAEREAKLMDIPIPLGVEPLADYFSESSCSQEKCSLGYRSRILYDDLMLFYTQEMERLGWKKSAEIETVETLLYFEKPTRFCVISLRPEKDKKGSAIAILIFTGKKV